MLVNWLRNLSGRKPSKRRKGTRNLPTRARRLELEPLESRTLPAPLDPLAFASLGAFNPGPGFYTIDTSALTLTGPSTKSDRGRVGRRAVSTFPQSRSLPASRSSLRVTAGCNPVSINVCSKRRDRWKWSIRWSFCDRWWHARWPRQRDRWQFSPERWARTGRRWPGLRSWRVAAVDLAALVPRWWRRWR